MVAWSSWLECQNPRVFIILLLFSFLAKFSHSLKLVVFHRCLNDRKSPQFSKTLIILLANLSSALVCIVLILLLISISSSFFSRFFGTVLRAAAMIGVTVTFMFHNFFNSLARSRYLSSFLLSFILILWSAGTTKSTCWHILFFLSVKTWLDLLA